MACLLAIDPGTQTGIAVFRKAKLIDVRVIDFIWEGELSRELFGLAKLYKPYYTAIELPQIYPMRNWKGDPNDLIRVAVYAGICAAACYEVSRSDIQFVHTREWKGQRPKEIDNAYTLQRLDPEEAEVLKQAAIHKSKLNHALDAVGIGLWFLNKGAKIDKLKKGISHE